MSKLTFVTWYVETVVYLDDQLVYCGETTAWGLLTALGYQCECLQEIPTHNIPPEFNRKENGHWDPPQSLKKLKEQWSAYETRVKQERIEYCKKEIARLRGELIELA